MFKIQRGINLIIGVCFLSFLGVPGIVRATDYALSFDAFLDNYVEIADNLILNFGESSFSIEAWIKTSFKDSDIDIAGRGLMENAGYMIGISCETGGAEFLLQQSSPQAYSQIIGDQDLSDNSWHHIVGVRDASLGQMFLYIDGNKAEERSDESLNTNTTELNYIGTGWNGPFQGPINEVRIYNRAISESEVSEHYQGIFNNETGLVGLWHFDEGQGSIAYDSSDQQNNGNISGAIWVAGRNYVEPPTPPPVEPPGPPSHLPQIEIESPKVGDRFSEIVEIKYKATDKNDLIGSPELGLGNDAVSLFYSVDGGENWILIAEKLPPIKSYQWNVSDLNEGGFYQLRALVEDKIEERAQQILDSLIIDRTPPLFDLSVEPSFSRGENVIIKIQATEPLLEAPKVTVRQRDYRDITVSPILGEGAFWEGEYEVIAGIDGTAKISLEGTDLAGNTSNIIRSGGFFHIGINPPPTPVVTSPLHNDIVDTLLISITGNIREDTKAVLILNNERVREVDPDPEGNFIIEDVELSKTFYKGLNLLQIISEDKGGNLSDPLSLSVKFNVSPTLKILEPQADDVLFATSTIKILATDENADELTFSIETSSDQGETWKEVVKNLKRQSFAWATYEFPDGEYILRITADDGFEKTQVISEKFLLRNFLPLIYIEKEPIITNKDWLNISGLAEIRREKYRGPRNDIIAVEYTIDGGENWSLAQAEDGAFDSVSEEFTISLTNLEEKLYNVLIRARDERGWVARKEIIVIVDFTPPVEPTINFPADREVFGDKEDINIENAGVQIKIEGLAEADNKIIVENGPLIFEGLSDSEGNFDMEVTLREHGENILKVSAIDPAGNKSETETSLVVIKNNPPDLKFLWPRINGGLNHIAEIVFEIQDRDLDPIKESSLSYRKLGDKSKTVLARNLKGDTFSFDVSNFQQGFYELILEATDGVSKNTIVRKFIIDNTPPQVSFEPLEKSAFTQSFTLMMSGTAQDDFSGIEYIEYSIDSENWFKALITSGYKEKETYFQVKHPFELEDGTYQVTFRATDVSGNVSKESESQEIIVDTTPPRIGSYTLSIGTIILLPEDNSFKIPDGANIKFTISLERDTKKTSLFIDNQEIELVKKTGLWEKEISLSGIGKHEILILAEDSLGNKTDKKEIGIIELINKGKVLSLENNPIEKVKMTIFIFNKENQSWVRWQGEAYDLMNPVFTNKNGEYELLLPPGRYQIILQKTGFKRVKSSGFDLLNPQFINFDFKFEPRTGLRGLLEDLLEKISF